MAVCDWHTDPIGEISLRHPARTGLRLVWRDQLCTELGFARSREWAPMVDVDLHTESLPPPEWAHNGVLHV